MPYLSSTTALFHVATPECPDCDGDRPPAVHATTPTAQPGPDRVQQPPDQLSNGNHVGDARPESGPSATRALPMDPAPAPTDAAASPGPDAPLPMAPEDSDPGLSPADLSLANSRLTCADLEALQGLPPKAEDPGPDPRADPHVPDPGLDADPEDLGESAKTSVCSFFPPHLLYQCQFGGMNPLPPYWPQGHPLVEGIPFPFTPLPPQQQHQAPKPASKKLRRSARRRGGSKNSRSPEPDDAPDATDRRVREICSALQSCFACDTLDSLMKRPVTEFDTATPIPNESPLDDEECPKCGLPYPGTAAAAGGPGVTRVTVHAFGSAVSGFADEASDVDVTLYLEHAGGVACTAHDHCVAWLRALRHGGLHPHFGDVALVVGARIPVLSLTHVATGVAVDVTLNNVQPLANTYLLRSYAAWAPVVQALGTFVKRWAKDEGVCGAVDGYLSPYTLVLLVLFFLQVGDVGFALPSLQQLLPGYDWARGGPAEAVLWALRCMYSACPPGEGAVPELFRRFCHFYLHFPWREEVVSVRLGRRARRGDPELARLPSGGSVLCIEDPFLPHQNLGLKLWRGRQQAEFFAALAAAAGPGAVALKEEALLERLQWSSGGECRLKELKMTKAWKGACRRGQSRSLVK